MLRSVTLWGGVKIIVTPAAEKDLRGIGHVERVRIMEKIVLYAANPDALRNQVTKLLGSDSSRLRIGNYRVLFAEDGMILRVLRVGHRREIYR